MKTNILATAAGLSDHDLLARLDVLAGREREACADLVALLLETVEKRRLGGGGEAAAPCTYPSRDG